MLDIADATLATLADNSVALRIGGLLNYTEYRELFLRAEQRTLSRGDGQELGIAGPLAPCPVGWHPFYLGMPKFIQPYRR